MKTDHLTLRLGIATITMLGFNAVRAVDLPADAALPVNSASNPGFVVRTAQASTNYVVANSFVRASKQLAGTLRDSANNLIPNIAIPGTNGFGAYVSDVVNFERDSIPFDIKDADDNYLGSFIPNYFPGIPGTEGEATQFATEAVGLVSLPAGVTTLGLVSSADRTDVNDDDGVSVFVGANPRDFFATKIADFSRGAAKAFTPNQFIENVITVRAPVAGVYPFRIVHWQTGRGSSLAFYSIDTNSAARVPIGDPNDPSALKAFRSSTSAGYNAPYIAEIAPAPGSAGNNSATAIDVTIADGTGATVVTNAIQLWLNGRSVVPQTISRAGSLVVIRYNPDAGRPDANNQVTLVYSDSKNASHTNQWSFGIITAGGSATSVTGQWDFDFGDLRASVGQALQYFDPTYDGPGGSATSKTRFGTCSGFGITPINGQEATVMLVPGDLTRKVGYVMRHGIAPNGGGNRVNQYTLIMDVFVETSGPGAASLLQTDTSNTSDGDLFWQGNNFGQGGGGYNGKGTFTAGAWHRVAAAYDMAATEPVVVKYVDGIKQDDWTANQGLDAERRALGPTAILFGDGDQDERRTMYVNSIQIRSGRLSDAELAALGGPDAAGIPVNSPQSTVSGQWDFDSGDLSPSVGKALKYVDPTYDGATGTAAEKTAFGTCTELGVPLVSGVDAKVMQVPGELSRKIGYVMTHGISPNGGGSKVNQYTLVMDVYVDTSGPGAASLLQTDLDNTSDGDLFWQGNNFGQGGDGYIGKGTFTAGAWHRVVAAYDEAAKQPVVTKYVDGVKQHDWTANQGLDAERRALKPTAILFGDGDQDERRKMWVKSIQIRAGKLTDAQCAALGAPTGKPIPVVLPGANVTGQWDFDSKDLSATVGLPLTYVDPTYDGPTGSAGTKTTFGTCTEMGVATINGEEAIVMQVPGDLTRQIGYVMDHGIAPNGGGSKVNQYTLIMDIFVNNSGPGAASLLQTDLNNQSDGDLFWQGNNFGQGAGGYNGLGTFTAGEWHRVAAAYNMAAAQPVVTKYVDGIFQDDWTANQGLDAERRALKPTAILFGDGDQDERRTMWVNSIQIRSGALSKAELASLGKPTATGIPVALTERPNPPLHFGIAGSEFVFSWPLDATGYKLETATNLAGPWTEVPGVANNSTKVTVNLTGNQYFRLKK